jgi:predicted nuclease with TOPRIM domain
MANYLELSKRVDALILDNASITCENLELKKRLEAVLKENKTLTEALEGYSDENKKLANEIANIQLKNLHLMEIVEGLEEEIEELDEECNRLSDELEEDESKVIHYIAVSLDLELCVPLVSENPIQAGQELINKCLAKGVPYGGFKVFEKSELL